MKLLQIVTATLLAAQAYGSIIPGSEVLYTNVTVVGANTMGTTATALPTEHAPFHGNTAVSHTVSTHAISNARYSSHTIKPSTGPPFKITAPPTASPYAGAGNAMPTPVSTPVHAAPGSGTGTDHHLAPSTSPAQSSLTDTHANPTTVAPTGQDKATAMPLSCPPPPTCPPTSCPPQTITVVVSTPTITLIFPKSTTPPTLLLIAMASLVIQGIQAVLAAPAAVAAFVDF